MIAFATYDYLKKHLVCFRDSLTHNIEEKTIVQNLFAQIEPGILNIPNSTSLECQIYQVAQFPSYS